MFTGIITDIGKIRTLEATPGKDTRFEITTVFETSAIDIGASIACAGVCLTVVDKGDDWFSAEVSNETLSCTNLDGWAVGTKINLERALKMGDELGGHVVTGHVDAVVELMDKTDIDGSTRMQLSLPAEFAGFVAPKGSVTLDGVSLTVNQVAKDSFTINIIPHTQQHTTFGDAKPGQRINFEIDVLARYVARLQEVEKSK